MKKPKRLRKRTLVEPDHPPAPAPASAPRPPAPPAEPVRRHSEISPLPPREVSVIIRRPKRPPMTPI